MEKLLVIGSSGLLGQRIIELGKDDYEVTSTYNEHSIQDKNAVHLDVTKRESITNVMQKVKPDIIIDTHHLPSVDYCETHPDDAWRINVEGTRNIAEAAGSFSCKYVFISTDNVYDGEKTTQYSEKDKVHPINYYGKSKLMAERVIEALDNDFIIARSSVLFGPHDGSIVAKMPFPTWLIQELKHGRPVKAVIDQYNNPTHTDSLSEFIFELISKDRKGIFNVTGKENLNRYDFAIKIADAFGLNKNLIKPIISAELNQPAKRPKKLALDISKVERATGVKGLSVEESLKMLKASI
jgi:dTDP-4-dehydrorhamnose reductase